MASQSSLRIVALPQKISYCRQTIAVRIAVKSTLPSITFFTLRRGTLVWIQFTGTQQYLYVITQERTLTLVETILHKLCLNIYVYSYMYALLYGHTSIFMHHYARAYIHAHIYTILHTSCVNISCLLRLKCFCPSNSISYFYLERIRWIFLINI